MNKQEVIARLEEVIAGLKEPTITYSPIREPLSEEAVSKFADAEYMVCNNAFTMGVRWAEQQHGIGVDDE
jgi:hypothetical protein